MWGNCGENFAIFPTYFYTFVFKKNRGYVSKVFDQETGEEKQGR